MNKELREEPIWAIEMFNLLVKEFPGLKPQYLSESEIVEIINLGFIKERLPRQETVRYIAHALANKIPKPKEDNKAKPVCICQNPWEFCPRHNPFSPLSSQANREPIKIPEKVDIHYLAKGGPEAIHYLAGKVDAIIDTLSEIVRSK